MTGLELIEETERVIGVKVVLYHDAVEGTYILARSYDAVGSEDIVLDEFTCEKTAKEMLKHAYEWLRSDGRWNAMMKNCEIAMIESWHDFAMIDHEVENRSVAASLEALPIYGMF